MKLGLEIHQRLDSKKLFCECPSIINENSNPELIIDRRLHPVMSELGEIDIASQAESVKDRIYEYQVFGDSACLVETDEEPPHPMNAYALKTVLAIGSNLNCITIDEIHIMRKTIIDGSNTSGFQRTALVAFNGHIETSKGPVGIDQISIEEESSGIVSNGETKAVYRLDRLGIPLIEITTAPDIKDGAHLLETAEKIGLLLRATGKVARGLGTIRQDVNISIEGGARIEIKGAQDLKILTKLVDIEVERQRNLIKLISEIKAKCNGNVILSRNFSDLTSLFVNTNSQIIRSGIKAGGKVIGLKLPNHKGVLGKELQPNKRYGTELSDYAKMAGVRGLIHSDETLDKYSISENELNSVKRILDIGESDAFVMVVAQEKQAKMALELVAGRAEMLEVPKETRKANPDGTTNYMRPLSGKARLYPETDVPAIVVGKELIEEAGKFKGESLEVKKLRLSKILNADMAEKMLRSRHLQLFEELVSLENDPVLVANTLENTIVSIRREGIELNDVEGKLRSLFAEYKNGLFVKAAIAEVLKHMSKGMSVHNAVEKNNLQKLSDSELKKIAEDNNFDIAKIMQKYRLRIDPADIAKIKKKG